MMLSNNCAIPSAREKGSALGPVNSGLKRLFDILMASVGLVLAAPLMALIAILIKIESPGPAIFSQERLGRFGRIFRMHKFRKFPAQWKSQGSGVTTACDVRMTRMGAFLERTKLDELPQLVNILKGEMSLVGPRPESLRFADLFVCRYKGVLDHVPGIFGPNQVAFRNECDLYPVDEEPEVFYRRELFPKKAENDLKYFGRANLFTDILWIIRGLWHSFAGIIRWRQFVGLHGGILLCDYLMIQISWLLAYTLRHPQWLFDQGQQFPYLSYGLLILPPVIIAMLFMGSVYRHPVRYFAIIDAARLSIVLTLGWVMGFLILVYLQRGISFALIGINWFILMFLLAIPRAARRLYCMRFNGNEKTNGATRVLIYGAGAGGMALSGWMSNGGFGVKMSGFLDDNPIFRGKRICGHEVLGCGRDLEAIHERHKIQEVWVTFLPEAERYRRLKSACNALQIRLVVFPELEPFARVRERAILNESACAIGR